MFQIRVLNSSSFFKKFSQGHEHKHRIYNGFNPETHGAKVFLDGQSDVNKTRITALNHHDSSVFLGRK